MSLGDRHSWQWDPRDDSHLRRHSRPGEGLLLILSATGGLQVEGSPEDPFLPKRDPQEDTSRTLILFFFLFMAAPMAYGSSPGRGVELELQLQPMPQPWQCWILNPLSEARVQTHILMDTM